MNSYNYGVLLLTDMEVKFTCLLGRLGDAGYLRNIPWVARHKDVSIR